MKIVTDFERVRRAMFRQGEGDRVPLFELSVHLSIKSKILGRPIKSVPDEIDFWRIAGYDFVPMRAGVRSIVRGLHPSIKEWRHTALTRERGESRGGWVNAESGLVRTREEFEKMPWPRPRDLGGYNDYASMEDYLAEMKRFLPADMKLIPQLGYVFMGAWQLMGLENFGLSLADDPGFVKAVIDRIGESQMGVLDILLGHDTVGAVWMPDDLCYNAGPVVSPNVYRQWVYPWYSKMIERCHGAGIPVGLHSDGDLTRILSDLVDCGFDAIHPFEPPLNDIVAIKKAWGHRIAVAGNIDLKTTLSAGTPEAVKEEVRDRIATLAPGGGWLLGSSNSIPDFIPVENYLAMISTGLDAGQYRMGRDSRQERR